ncbi:MAG: hypothetical protein ACM3SQ_11230 [Betaproteobacteria bacterium]
MGVPWLRVIDAVLGVADAATRRGTGRRDLPPEVREEQLAAAAGPRGALEARLAGVVVAALKETFDRDSRRLDLEREQIEAEREHAERALHLELLRQVGEREIGRLRLTAGVAVVTWLTTLFFAARLAGGPVAARALVGVGWVLLLAALACAFAAQSRVGNALRRASVGTTAPEAIDGGLAGALAPWFIVVGLALVGLAVLV